MLQLSDRNPVDEALPAHQALLADLQCNILSSHQRANTHYFFLNFDGLDSEAVKAVLHDLAVGQGLPDDLKLPSELQSRARRALGRKNRGAAANTAWAEKHVSGSPFSTNLMLSARCYREFLPELAPPRDRAFRDGLPGRDGKEGMFSKLNDPDFSGRGPAMHALYTVGYDDAGAWQAAHTLLQKYFQTRKVDAREEAGYQLRHGPGNSPIEPFGYRDGITQPFFYVSQAQARGPATTLHARRGASLAPLSLVLVRDPHGEGVHSCGTYAVYRKLKQNIASFYGQAASLAASIPLPDNQIRLTPEEVADRLIGRRLDGTPLDAPPGAPVDDSGFTFPSNSVCPLHAHARKVNPRTYDGVPRIVRRSTVYGPRLKRNEEGRPILDAGQPVTEDGKALTGDEVGLMFLCYQANIADQFEAIQARYANDLRGGADTVIGQLLPEKPGDAAPVNYLGFNRSTLKYPYDKVVDLLEGEYCFAPSLSFFSTKLRSSGAPAY